MNKKTIAALVTIVILLIAIILLMIFNKDNMLTSKEKLYSFEEYTLLQDQVKSLSNQLVQDEEIISKIESGDYTFDNPLVILNPYKISPLTAIIGFQTSEKETLTITIKAKDNGKDLVYTTKEDTLHYIPVYGLYLNYNNTIEIKGSSQTKEINIHTENYEENDYFSLQPQVIKNNLPENDNDFMFLSTFRGTYNVAYDQAGEIRWFLSNQIYKQASLLANGNYLLANNDIDINESTSFIEVDPLGKIYNTYELTHNYKYNYVELPNGNILYSSVDGKVVELSRNDGKIEIVYDINKIINSIDSKQKELFTEKFGVLSEEDTHDFINALDYDEKTNSILVGIYPYSTIINLKRDGNINWIFANPDNYTNSFSKYFLTQSNNFTYPMGNYNAKYQNGKLTLMDNGWDFSKSDSCTITEELKSSVRDYEIDIKNKSITEVFNYSKNYLSYRLGDYQINGSERNILFAYVFYSFITPTDVCSMHSEPNFNSKLIVLNNDEEVFEMSIPNSHNYFEKRSIINDSYLFSKIDTKNFTASLLGDQYKEESYKDKFSSSSLYSIPLELSGNTLSIMLNEDDYKVVLLNEYGVGRIFDVNNNKVNIEKDLGKSLILIKTETELYNTGYYLDI